MNIGEAIFKSVAVVCGTVLALVLFPLMLIALVLVGVVGLIVLGGAVVLVFVEGVIDGCRKKRQDTQTTGAKK
jgi:hypothetical protein